MDRQKLFSHCVTTLDGQGQGRESQTVHGTNWSRMICSYFPDGHPGCNIGCQPGFRERFEGKIEPMGVDDVIDEEDIGREVADFFGIENWDDRCFLVDLQDLHDVDANWAGQELNQRKKWDRTSLAAFATKWGLKVPEIPA